MEKNPYKIEAMCFTGSATLAGAAFIGRAIQELLLPQDIQDFAFKVAHQELISARIGIISTVILVLIKNTLLNRKDRGA